MKKRLTLIVLVLVCALALSACGCKHETWNEADCETPKTCAACGETEGAPLGHTWLAATCETAKTCEVCGKTEGEIPGHSWVEADCENAKTCSSCRLTDGEALGHVWQDATTEAPKTCETCGKTEGERIITDERFTTAATLAYHGKWAYSFSLTAEMMGIEGFDKGIDCILYLELRNDGTSAMTIALADPETMEKDMTDYLIQMLYSELDAYGMSREEVNEAFYDAYGMSLEEYAALSVKEMDLAGELEDLNKQYVYYVENGQLFMAYEWTDDMGEPTPVSLDGDTLTFEENLSELGIPNDKLVFTRVIDGE